MAMASSAESLAISFNSFHAHVISILEFCKVGSHIHVGITHANRTNGIGGPIVISNVREAKNRSLFGREVSQEVFESASLWRIYSWIRPSVVRICLIVIPGQFGHAAKTVPNNLPPIHDATK